MHILRFIQFVKGWLENIETVNNNTKFLMGYVYRTAETRFYRKLT